MPRPHHLLIDFDSIARDKPVSENDASSPSEGDQHAVQSHRSESAGAEPAALQATPPRPESHEFVTADAYLSGNVRAKLAKAEATGFTRNAEALSNVQPTDVLPGDIDANLGAPWIPDGDVKAFAANLFRAEPAAIRIGHLKKEAVWSIDADYFVERSVAAASEFGTPRINGTALLELALNM